MKFLTQGVLALSLLAGTAAGPAFAQTSTDPMTMEKCGDGSPNSTMISSECPFERERRKSDTTQPNNVDAENPSTSGVDPNGSDGSNDSNGGTENPSNSNGDSSQDSGGSSDNSGN